MTRKIKFRLAKAWGFPMLACALLAGCAGEPPSKPPPPAAPKRPWDRIVLVGASVSAGHITSEPFGGPKTARYHLDRYLNAALLAPHEPIKNFASAFFFVRPEATGRRQIKRAPAARPTLVIALDFLFWYCYGDGDTDEERLKRFAEGLKLLESIPCPLIVGDIPDASGVPGKMLRPNQIPRANALSDANRLLRQWAADRPLVVIVPLARFMRQSRADQRLTVRGQNFPDGKPRELLQADGLHPTPPGCSVLALMVLDAFVPEEPCVSASEVRWDFTQVLQMGFGGPKFPGPPKPAVAAP